MAFYVCEWTECTFYVLASDSVIKWYLFVAGTPAGVILGDNDGT